MARDRSLVRRWRMTGSALRFEESRNGHWLRLREGKIIKWGGPRGEWLGVPRWLRLGGRREARPNSKSRAMDVVSDPGGKIFINWGGPGGEGLGIARWPRPGGFPRMAISSETSSQHGDVRSSLLQCLTFRRLRCCLRHPHTNEMLATPSFIKTSVSPEASSKSGTSRTLRIL